MAIFWQLCTIVTQKVCVPLNLKVYYQKTKNDLNFYFVNFAEFLMEFLKPKNHEQIVD